VLSRLFSVVVGTGATSLPACAQSLSDTPPVVVLPLGKIALWFQNLVDSSAVFAKAPGRHQLGRRHH
jgi:hypothetical protein